MTQRLLHTWNESVDSCTHGMSLLIAEVSFSNHFFRKYEKKKWGKGNFYISSRKYEIPILDNDAFKERCVIL